MKVSNKGKDIKKNDSSFERHDQFLAEVQTILLLNMFDNHDVQDPGKLKDANSYATVVSYMLNFLDVYDVQLYSETSSRDERGRGRHVHQL